MTPHDPPAPSPDDDWDDDWGDFEDWSDAPVDGRAARGAGNPLAGLEDDPRVKAGVEHLQRAAHEAIAASRALLDVAEEMVDSPGGINRMFGILGELGDLAGRLARPPAGSTPDDGDDDPPVQRIPVS